MGEQELRVPDGEWPLSTGTTLPLIKGMNAQKFLGTPTP